MNNVIVSYHILTFFPSFTVALHSIRKIYIYTSFVTHKSFMKRQASRFQKFVIT